MFGLDFFELLLVVVIVVLLFGSKKLPEVGKGLGEAVRNFNQALKGEEGENKTTPNNSPSVSEKKK